MVVSQVLLKVVILGCGYIPLRPTHQGVCGQGCDCTICHKYCTFNTCGVRIFFVHFEWGGMPFSSQDVSYVK